MCPTRNQPVNKPYWMRRPKKNGTPDTRKQGRSRKVIVAGITVFTTAIVGAGAVTLWNWGTSQATTQYHNATDKSDLQTLISIERYQTVQGETWVLPGQLSPTSDDTKLLSDPSISGSNGKTALERFRSWARKKGGADPNVSFVKLIVQGGRHETVRMVGMRAVIKTRSEPLNGTLLWAPAQGGENVTQLGVNLDESDPVARTVEHSEFGEPHFTAPYFDTQQTKTLNYGEQEVFLIEAHTASHYVEWCLGMDLLIGLQQRSMQVCPEGQNIRTTAVRLTNPSVHGPKFQEYRTLYLWEDVAGGFHPADSKTYTW